MIFVKVNLIPVLKRELDHPSWTREEVALGTATDLYQPIEGHYRLTRQSLEALARSRTPVGLVTKGPMVVRDKDVLRDVSKQASCTVCVSVPSVDEHAWEKMEPGTAPPLQRLRAVRELCDAGVRAGVLMAPIVPGISSQPSRIERTIKAISDHGADFVGVNVLHLEGGTRDHFMKFLSAEYPELWRDTAGCMRDASTRRTVSGTKSGRWCLRSRRSTAWPSEGSIRAEDAEAPAGG